MKIKEAIDFGASMLKNVERPRFESEILLAYALQNDRVYIHSHSEEILSNKDKRFYIECLKKRAKDFPIEYIIKKVSFYSEEFFIDEGVLIPRPETEILIDKVLENVEEDENIKIAEIGVGSGVISIILAKKLKNAKIVATDISQKALEVARKNIKMHSVEDRISLKNCSFLDDVKEYIDVLVSNPPYIKNSYQLDRNVLYEPKEALFGGENGDEILKRIIDLAVDRRVKLLVCEMGYDQREGIEKHCQKYGLKPSFYRDLAGFYRGFILKISQKNKGVE